MAAATRTRPGAKSALRPSRRSLRLARDGDAASISPARATQSRLSELWTASAELGMDEKWSPRRSLAFIMLSCGGFWTIVFVCASRALH
jgi:hypothetical protein